MRANFKEEMNKQEILNLRKPDGQDTFELPDGNCLDIGTPKRTIEEARMKLYTIGEKANKDLLKSDAEIKAITGVSILKKFQSFVLLSAI